MRARPTSGPTLADLAPAIAAAARPGATADEIGYLGFLVLRLGGPEMDPDYVYTLRAARPSDRDGIDELVDAACEIERAWIEAGSPAG